MNPHVSLVVAAAFLWGVSGGIGSVLTSQGWDPLVVSFYRGAIGLVFALGWLGLRPTVSGLGSRRLWLWSAIAGVGVAGAFSFYFVSISEGSIAVAATLLYCAPIYVYALSFSLGQEKPSVVKVLAISMTLPGVVLLTGFHGAGGLETTPIALVSGVLSGVFCALFIFGFNFATPHGSPQAILSVAFAVLTAVLVLVADIHQIRSAALSPSVAWFVFLGILGAGVSFMLYIRGLAHTGPAVASVVAMVEPVTAAVFGVVFLSQSLGGRQLVGMGLVLVAVSLLGTYREKSSSA